MFIFHGFGQVQSNNRFTIARKILIMVQFMSWIGLQKTHKQTILLRNIITNYGKLFLSIYTIGLKKIITKCIRENQNKINIYS